MSWKPKVFQIILDNPRSIFYPGMVITGRVILELDSRFSFQVMKVACIGIEVRSWDGGNKNGSGLRYLRQFYPLEFSRVTTEFILHKEIILVADEVRGDCNGITLEAGRYSYPFEFELPMATPCSVIGDQASLKYEIEAIIDQHRAFHAFVKIADIFIYANLNLNSYPLNLQPTDIKLQKNQGFLWCQKELVGLFAKLERTAFVLGETIKIPVVVTNKSRRSGVFLEIYLNQRMTITPRTFKNVTEVCKLEEKRIVSISSDSMNGDVTIMSWVAEIKIPDESMFLPATLDRGTRMYTIEYFLEVILHLPWAEEMCTKIPIVLGTHQFAKVKLD